ncbi:MAG: HAD-IA family hydrolase [Rouxiella badensis]|uniref:HAD-IA family hydrolase n=1 Tax=Rouxiella badensis TaxID=1646377 RepID=UPI003C35D0E6
MIKALMVDVDGVLVCGRPIDSNPWASCLDTDLGLSAADLHREFFLPYWDEIVVEKLGLVESLEISLPKIAPELSIESLVRYWFENDSFINMQLLNELKRYRANNIKIYLATNQEHMRAAYIMNELALSKYVDGIYYSAALGYRKPSEEFFKAITSLSGFYPEELLLLDDTPLNVSTAQSLGWNACLWTNDSFLEKELLKVSEPLKG